MIAQPRFCMKCQHVHGGGKYGLCFERLVNGALCPCIVADAAPARRRRRRRPRQNTSEVSDRTLSRRATAAYATLSAEGRAIYQRAARRLSETDLYLREYAAEVGLDPRLALARAAGVVRRRERDPAPGHRMTAFGGILWRSQRARALSAARRPVAQYRWRFVHLETPTTIHLIPTLSLRRRRV